MTVYNWLLKQLVIKGLPIQQAREVLTLTNISPECEDWNMLVDEKDDEELLTGIYYDITPHCLAYINLNFPEDKQLQDKFLSK